MSVGVTPFVSAPLQLQPRLAERIWGGQRLGLAGPQHPIGEAWAVYEGNPVVAGPYAGQTLGDLTRRFPAQVLGQQAQGNRFPLLIKLLDCADWLSVQVHPNDVQARELEGEGELGKTEAWHLLEADENAQLISGVRAGTGEAELHRAILAGEVLKYAERHPVRAGDTVMMPAGTLHALGPGLFLYEVQQTSDTTYRVHDWDRPASAGRALHLEQSARVTTTRQASPQAAPPHIPGTAQPLTTCDYFVLDRLTGPEVACDTAGQSFHALTLTAGAAQLEWEGEPLPLRPYDSVVIPAALGPYRLRGDFQGLRSRLPGS